MDKDGFDLRHSMMQTNAVGPRLGWHGRPVGQGRQERVPGKLQVNANAHIRKLSLALALALALSLPLSHTRTHTHK